MNLSVRGLQEGALVAMAGLVTGFDMHLEVEITARSCEPEYVDATEILVEFGRGMMDSIHAFLAEQGAWVPSSILDLLGESARLFGTAYYLNEGGQSGDEEAMKANEKLHEAYRQFHELLESKGWTVP